MTNPRNPEHRDNSAHKDLETLAQAAFSASLDSIDGRTRSKLTQARHAAVAELRKSRERLWQRAALGLAGLSAAMLAVWIAIGQWTSPTPGEVPLDDLDLVANAPNLELLEDVEFYVWVAHQPASGAVEAGQVSDGTG